MSLSSILSSERPSDDALIREARRRGMLVEIVDPAEQARRAAELARCASDPVYWIKSNCRTFDPRNLESPYVAFDLWPRQEELILWLMERLQKQEPGVIEKSRDVGVSWCICAWMLWLWHFVDGFAGGVGSRKLEYVDSKGDPKTLFEKFRIMIENEPAWMRPPDFNAKKNDLESRLLNPAKKSTIIGEGGEHIGRGGRCSVYIVDEYNHIENSDVVDAALSRNSNVIIYLGTANGPKGIYLKRNTWKCFTFGWWDDIRRNAWNESDRAGRVVAAGHGLHPSAVVPKHDTYPTKTPTGNVVRYPWYEADIELYKDQPFLRKAETDIDYIGTGSPRFDREFLLVLKDRLKNIFPFRHEYPGQPAENASGAWSGELKVWKEPVWDHYYLVSADVAEGESANTDGDPDFNIAHVYDCETWEQVAVYKSRCETFSYALDLSVIGVMYNYAEVCVERTGPGLATIKALVESSDIAYPCVYGVLQGDDHTKHGMTTTTTSKKTGNSDLASFIVDMKDGLPGFVWNDPETLDELFFFSRLPNGREQAEKGHHDDHCTCCRQAATRLQVLSTRRQMSVGPPPPPKNTYGAGRRR